ncbi:helix-turn-helix domain-containing protein, partial [Rhodoplanes roseus]
PVDRHVGGRVRMRRMMLGMSQEKLGDALSLTFQQVQKYEKGTNRIGASRLQEIATVLQVPVAFFFEGMPADGASPGRSPAAERADAADARIAAVLATPEGLALVDAFGRIDDGLLRRKLVDLVGHLARPAWPEATALPAPHLVAAE